jgi:hypothetical protein
MKIAVITKLYINCDNYSTKPNEILSVDKIIAIDPDDDINVMFFQKYPNLRKEYAYGSYSDDTTFVYDDFYLDIVTKEDYIVTIIEL